mgnify:CR=1 FL=1
MTYSIIDRGHAGLVFVGLPGVEIGVSVSSNGGHETNSWRIGAALDAAGIYVPEPPLVRLAAEALRHKGVVVRATEPALEAPIAAHRVWAVLFRSGVGRGSHCSPDAEGDGQCVQCMARERAAFDSFEHLSNRAHDAARAVACMVRGRSGFSPPVDRERFNALRADFETATAEARKMCGAIAHRTTVREMLVALTVAEGRVSQSVKILG